MNILTVGQKPRDRALLSACLRGGRWRLLHVDEVHSCVDLLFRHDIQAVISDLNLPDGCWLDLLRVTGSLPGGTPIIVTTESLDASAWADALSRGAYDVLVKPFEVKEVLYVVRSACLHQMRTEDRAHVFAPVA